MQIIGFLHTDSVFKPYPKGSCNPNHTVRGTSSCKDEYTAVVTSETTSYFFSNTHGRQLSPETCHFEPPKCVALEKRKSVEIFGKIPKIVKQTQKAPHVHVGLPFLCIYFRLSLWLGRCLLLASPSLPAFAWMAEATKFGRPAIL